MYWGTWKRNLKYFCLSLADNTITFIEYYFDDSISGPSVDTKVSLTRFCLMSSKVLPFQRHQKLHSRIHSAFCQKAGHCSKKQDCLAESPQMDTLTIINITENHHTLLNELSSCQKFSIYIAIMIKIIISSLIENSFLADVYIIWSHIFFSYKWKFLSQSINERWLGLLFW